MAGAAENIGTAVASLGLDITDWTVAIERAKAQEAGLGNVVQQEAAKMNAASRRVIESFERRANRIGLNREESLLLDIQTRTTGKVQEELTRRVIANTAAMRQQGQAASQVATQVNAYGLSAKQQVAAMRQVPAQITDIFTSLQGGQNPLTVLIQQGGQLKDVFGGVVPAVRALASQVIKLVNPISMLAVAGGAVAYSFVNASSEQSAFAVAIAQAGDQADITVGKLQNMAVAISDLEGVSTGSASDTVAKVTATGRFTAEQIMLVATAAERMRVATGQSVDETIEAFTRIAKDPVSAILELNESQHFLTQETYETIRALQEQGDMAGAQEAALDAYASRVNNVTTVVEENIGYLQQFTKTVKGLWADIADAVMGIGRATTNADLVRQQQSNIEGLIKARERMRSGSIFQGGVYGGMTERGYAESIARAQAEIRRLTMFDNVQGTPTGENLVVSQAQRQLDALNAGNRSREERQQLEEQQIVNLYKQLGIAKEDKRVQDALTQSRKQFEDSKPKGRSGESAARALANAQAGAELQSIKDALAEEQAAIQNSTKLLQAQYSARLVLAADYYAQQRELIQRDTQSQEEALVQQIEFLKSRNVAGKDAVTVLKEIGQLEAKLAKVRADGATALAILGIQEADAAEKRKEAINSYREALDRSNESSRQAVEAQLRRIMYGEEEAAQQERIAKIIAEGAEKQRELSRELAKTNDVDMYNEKLTALQDYMDEQVRIAEEGYAEMKEAQADWLNGVNSGIADWISRTSDVASQINAITQRSLDGAADALTNWAITGKFTVRDFLTDIGKEIVKFMMKQAVLEFIKYFLGSWTGGNSAPDAGSYSDLYASDSSFSTGFAKGGAFPSAHPSLSAYSGTVVSKPTPFYFARGAALGVMGEAGDEGIFPLERGSDGKLGVKAVGGTGGGDVNVGVSVTVNSDGTASSKVTTDGERATLYKQFANDMASIAQEQINRAQMPGGSLWKAGVGAR